MAPTAQHTANPARLKLAQTPLPSSLPSAGRCGPSSSTSLYTTCSLSSQSAHTFTHAAGFIVFLRPPPCAGRCGPSSSTSTTCPPYSARACAPTSRWAGAPGPICEVWERKGACTCCPCVLFTFVKRRLGASSFSPYHTVAAPAQAAMRDNLPVALNGSSQPCSAQKIRPPKPLFLKTHSRPSTP